jgi:hypothetical protein
MVSSGLQRDRTPVPDSIRAAAPEKSVIERTVIPNGDWLPASSKTRRSAELRPMKPIAASRQQRLWIIW